MEPAAARAAEHLEALDPSCSPSMQKREPKENKKTCCSQSTSLGDGVNLPARHPLHRVCCHWLDRVEQKHQVGNAWTALTDELKKRTQADFQTGSLSSFPPPSHPSLCNSHKHPHLERLKQNSCLYQICLSSVHCFQQHKQRWLSSFCCN